MDITFKNESDDDVLYEFALPGGKEYFKVTREFFKAKKTLYPSVDLEVEFEKMRAWLESNVSRRKYHAGVPRFINSWLSRVQMNLDVDRCKAVPAQHNLSEF